MCVISRFRLGLQVIGFIATLVITPLRSPAQDCNGNGVPDAADIHLADPDGDGLISPDCNVNLIPDECDVALGTSCDEDNNGIPDECDFTQQFVMESDDTRGNFGIAVAICDDTALVGDSSYDVNSFRNGAAFVFSRFGNEWVETGMLTANIPGTLYQFGNSIAIDSSTLIVGEFNSGSEITGAAYVFEEIGDSWQQTARLIASDAGIADRFGWNVDISGNTAVVGAPFAGAPGLGPGAVYVFRKTTSGWEQIARLESPQALMIADFGTDVALEGPTLIVGSPGEQEAGVTTGRVYVYEDGDNGWQRTYFVRPDNGIQTGGRFGHCVALSGDTIVVGAPYALVSGAVRGAAYVYRKIGASWIQVAKLTIPSAPEGSQFGAGVDIKGSRIVVGCPYDALEGENAGGAVYFYENTVGNTWQLTGVRRKGMPVEGNKFGISVALGQTEAFVGASNDATTLPALGAAYTFGIPQPTVDCDGNGIPDACEAPLGTIAGFVAALLNASSDPLDICVYDGDDNGVLDGLDVAPFVVRLLAD